MGDDARMADSFEVTTVIDRPIEQVFAFLADPEGPGTRVTLHNTLEGNGFGKLIAPMAPRAARTSAGDFGRAIKAAVKAS